jgi:hypothetical protein
MPPGEDVKDFRRGLISAVGAFRLDHPDATGIDYVRIFPDLFRRLRDHFYEERRRQLRHGREEVLRTLSGEGGAADEKASARVESTLRIMRERYGYCPHCARDAIVFLMRRRYDA